jgi:hypothetical protein
MNEWVPKSGFGVWMNGRLVMSQFSPENHRVGNDSHVHVHIWNIVLIREYDWNEKYPRLPIKWGRGACVKWLTSFEEKYRLSEILCWLLSREFFFVCVRWFHPILESPTLIWLVSAASLFVWLVVDCWYWFVLRKVLLAGCWWLVYSERKVLLAGDW